MSFQKKQMEPSSIVADAIPLKDVKDFKISFHQNEPLLLFSGKPPLG
jgi:hypothetical protein